METSAFDIKKECAKEALAVIPNHSIIGLGGGSTISHLIHFIKEKDNFEVQVVTPSMQTKLLCLENGLDVLHTECVDHVDLAFDGCDQVDAQLCALKSGGGIHSLEKLIGSMADEYILLVDESKYVPALTFDQPVVLELLTEAMAYVRSRVEQLGGRPVMRRSAAKDGFTVTDNGHLLMDVSFDQVHDIRQLETNLQAIRGVLDTSLFVDVATKALIAGSSGMKWLNKTTHEVSHS
ncbi:ribose 5-phosphate isomerase A [Sporolactobacillus shoreicorticis]|uniref:Ribose 5-phosphate isomerase A n=1 Tax=Sporolactobacillus shoreicorticis TaxID=1923877 RepID=A0ABW5S4S3_9BACL|nr:ribose 5-phosphate isomerase A [Sporolactobacillus shoreicorticis]MCO7127174.1 ribose 5-phosphate isomerase A [Sporolactobacillus shoreicorticis]